MFNNNYTNKTNNLNELFYNQHNYHNLICGLDLIEDRIKLENWLVDKIQYSHFSKNIEEFKWECKVIKLICFKSANEKKATPKKQQEEDALLSKLIMRASPLISPSAKPIEKEAYKEALKTLDPLEMFHIIKKTPLKQTVNALIRRICPIADKYKILKKAIEDNDLPTLIAWVEGHENIKADLIHRIENQVTLIEKAILLNQQKVVVVLNRIAPDQLDQNIVMQNKYGNTPIHDMVFCKNIEMLKLLYSLSPEKCTHALTVENGEGVTPSRYAILSNWVQLAEIVYTMNSRAFRKEVAKQDEYGNTLIMDAVLNGLWEMSKFLIKTSLDASLQINNKAHSALTIVKRDRFKNSEEITKLLKKNEKLREHYKEFFRRKAAAHAWHLEGYSLLIDNKGKKICDIPLEGYEIYPWYHLFGKDLTSFMEAYPRLQTQIELDLLRYFFNSGANSRKLSFEAKLESIKKGLPIVIGVGSKDHAVCLLIWGNRLVICNRSEHCYPPMEFFHFNVDKMTVEDLAKMEWFYNSNAEFRNTFYNNIYVDLNFYKEEDDKYLDSFYSLDLQTVNNCSFVSTITSVFAFQLLAKSQGVDVHGRLKPKDNESILTKVSQINQAQEWYQTWFSFEQLLIFERLIEPLKKASHPFKMDNKLVENVLYKAYRLPLDKVGQEKLGMLTDIYLNSVPDSHKKMLEESIVYWKSLSKLFLG